MRTWKRTIVTAAAGLLLAAVSAGAQAGGQASGGASAPRTGFRVENLILELSSFLPEEYARLRTGPVAGTQPQQRPGGRFNLPQFKRDAKLMLTAAQVDALIPVLQDLQKTPFPTPSQAKKVTTTVDATLTKQQKDAYDAYARERDKAIEELRKQYASRNGAPGQGPTGGQGAQGSPGQRPQADPAELRARMLDQFIKNLQDYRKGLA